jgi:hypothetical protein
MGLFSIFKTKNWNNEPAQIQLATMLGYAGQAAVRGESTFAKEAEIIKFLAHSGWKKGEAGDRIVHACSMVKIAGSPKVYEQAKRIGESLYHSLHTSW